MLWRLSTWDNHAAGSLFPSRLPRPSPPLPGHWRPATAEGRRRQRLPVPSWCSCPAFTKGRDVFSSAGDTSASRGKPLGRAPVPGRAQDRRAKPPLVDPPGLPSAARGHTTRGHEREPPAARRHHVTDSPRPAPPPTPPRSGTPLRPPRSLHFFRVGGQPPPPPSRSAPVPPRAGTAAPPRPKVGQCRGGAGVGGTAGVRRSAGRLTRGHLRFLPARAGRGRCRGEGRLQFPALAAPRSGEKEGRSGEAEEGRTCVWGRQVAREGAARAVPVGERSGGGCGLLRAAGVVSAVSAVSAGCCGGGGGGPGRRRASRLPKVSQWPGAINSGRRGTGRWLVCRAGRERCAAAEGRHGTAR